MEKRLGRGLGSLLLSGGMADSPSAIDLNSISPNPFQPRRSMDPAGLEELRDSIRQHGLLQPVVLRRQPAGDYQLISGERRWRAARLAGLTSVPALVRDNVTDDEMLELALVENVQRRDLNPIERAEAFHALMMRMSLTQEAVAERVGLKRATVANLLRLLDLPETAKGALAKGLISMGHARALLGVKEAGPLNTLLERAVRDELSVRDVERAVRELGETAGTQAPVERPTPRLPAWVGAVESRLRDALATRVKLNVDAEGKGSIVVDFYSSTDLDRLLEHLAPASKV